MSECEGMNRHELLDAADKHGVAVFIDDDGNVVLWGGDDVTYQSLRALASKAKALGLRLQ